MTLLAVYTSVANVNDARRLARACVERKLAACVQLSQIESFYPWKGELQQDNEVRILLKTTRGRYAELEALLRAEHPYDLPAIHAIEVAQASPAYEDWLREQVGEN